MLTFDHPRIQRAVEALRIATATNPFFSIDRFESRPEGISIQLAERDGWDGAARMVSLSAAHGDAALLDALRDQLALAHRDFHDHCPRLQPRAEAAPRRVAAPILAPAPAA